MKPRNHRFAPALGVMALALALLTGCAEGPPGRPNLLVMVADDMGWSDLGAFGGEIPTPHLDALKDRGAMLMSFRTAPTCSPTRAMLLSGTDHHAAGIGTMEELRVPNLVGLPGYEGVLNARVRTLPERLRAAGYQTLFSGKWHLGREVDQSPSARGFDRSFALVRGAGNHFGERLVEPPFILRNVPPGAGYRRDGRVVSDRGPDWFSSDAFTTELLDFLQERDPERPFFALLSFTAPHWPLQAPLENRRLWEGQYKDGWDKVRAARFKRQKELGLVAQDATLPARAEGVKAWAQLSTEERAEQERLMEVYAAMVENLDANVGRMLDYLERQGLARNTVVLFFSDNGPDASATASPLIESISREYDNRLKNIGARDSFVGIGPGWAQVSATPFRGVKMTFLEGGVRVPAIIAGPGIEAGRALSASVTVRDVLPTLLETAGMRVDDADAAVPVTGKSLWPALRGEQASVHGDAALSSELLGNRVVWQGDWKLVALARPQRDFALYNLASDPFETTDLSDTHPEKRAELVAEWEAYAERFDVVLPDGSLF